jgi:pimeloyl-ACP methyl ester carboxylesterase
MRGKNKEEKLVKSGGTFQPATHNSPAFSNEPETLFVALSDVRLGVERWPGHTAILPVFLHGLGDGSFVWRDVVPRLRAQLASIAIDLRGHGRSDWDTEGDYSLADHAVDVCRTIWHFGLDRVLLIGHSMGAAVSLRVAAHLGESVAGLVLIDHGPSSSNSAHEWIARELASARRNFTTPEDLAQELQSGRPFARLDILRRYAAASLRPSPDGGLVLRRDPRIDMEETSLEDYQMAANRDMPVLIVRGAASAALSAADAEAARAMIPGATLVTIARAGHAIMSENPEDLAEVLDAFLESVAKR